MVKVMATISNFVTITLAVMMIILFVCIQLQSKGGKAPRIVLGPVSTDDKAVSNSQCDSMLDRDLIPVNLSEFRIQLLAAMPGSGSDWARISIGLLTGYYVDSVYEYRKSSITNMSVATKDRPIYYKTHYPYFTNVGKVDTYLHQNARRVVVIIRDPFDAGFSEYVRERIQVINPPPNKDGRDMKYAGINKSIKTSDFLTGNDTDKNRQSSEAFQSYYQSYLKNYENFHTYWLQEYSGEIKIVSHNDLVRNTSLFIDMAEFFGYDYRSRPLRKQRKKCFLMNIAKTKLRKRPSIPFVEKAKETLQLMFKNKTQKQIELIKELLHQKLATKTVSV